MFSVYILYSEHLDGYYIGSTSDVEGKLRRHLSNYKGYTSRAKDWRIVYTESFSTKELALLRERELKSWKSRKLIANLISSAGLEHSDL